MKHILGISLALLALTAMQLPAAPAQKVIIPVNTANSSLVLGTNDDGQLLFLHYGGRIADPSCFNGWKSYRRADYSTDPLAYPTAGGRYFNGEALCVTYPDGGINTELSYVSHSTAAGEGFEETRVLLRDPKTLLEVTLSYKAYAAEDVLVCHSEIVNPGRKGVEMQSYYSSCMHVRADKYLLTHFYGSWAREMQVERELLGHGTKSIESRVEVRTTHNENPSFMLSLNTESFSETDGEVIAGALAWSGNYKLNFQMDETGEVNIISGINPFNAAYTLQGRSRFTTPDMIYTFSAEGAGRASRNLHDWARNYGCYDNELVPTLLNSWEGAYFDFDTRVLTDMIDDAASLGLEMFVLDDGWFGKKYPRNNSRNGLGDWMLNDAKIPEGIGYLADYAHAKGMKFGIWIEPEMVNPTSELYENHPDWIVAEKGRPLTMTRGQYLLDLARPEVRDFVFGVFDATMQLGAIDYIKWDANRHVENPGSGALDEQSGFWVEYVRGFYSVMERIRAKYPSVMVQACSSGGGRVEYGALKYFNEVWTSDDTEARMRAKIQYGTNMIYPAFVTGSHVSAVPNHQTGNVTPLKFRFDMAAAGRLGMELQPRKMTAEEKAFAARAIESYKGFRDLVEDGDLYRLLSPYETDHYALMYVSKDKRRAVVFAYCLEYQGRVMIPQIRLQGLDKSLKYRLTELNVDKSGFWGNGRVFGGDFLASEGINPQLVKICDSAVYLLEAE